MQRVPGARKGPSGGPEGVTFPASSSTTGPSGSRIHEEPSRKPRLRCGLPSHLRTVPSLCRTVSSLRRTVPSLRRNRAVPAPASPRTPHVPGVSWRSQPARAATRRPGRTSDGRGGHGREERRRTSDGRRGPDRTRGASPTLLGQPPPPRTLPVPTPAPRPVVRCPVALVGEQHVDQRRGEGELADAHAVPRLTAPRARAAKTPRKNPATRMRCRVPIPGPRWRCRIRRLAPSRPDVALGLTRGGGLCSVANRRARN